MIFTQFRRTLLSPTFSTCRRSISTLPNNPHIYVHPQSPAVNVLSFLPTSPPTGSLAIGVTSKIPPTSDSLRENQSFMKVLQSVIREHATNDPEVISQAQAYASSAGSSLGSGGVFFPQSQHRRSKRGQDSAVEAALVVTVLEELLLRVVREVQEEEDTSTSVIREIRQIMVVPPGPRTYLAVSRSTRSVTS